MVGKEGDDAEDLQVISNKARRKVRTYWRHVKNLYSVEIG
jgi:hypothetical protein